MTEGDIKGFSLCRGGPKISHLFFTNDTLLFCRAELREVQVIKNILDKYELASGQKINPKKTTIFFGKSVSVSSKTAIKNFLGVLEIKEYEKYLSLPAVVGKNKRASFNYIRERVWGKLQRVEGKIVASGGVGGVVESIGASNSHIRYELFQAP